MSQLEMDMVVLGDISRWPPRDIMAMSTLRRRRLVEALVERQSAQSSPPPPDVNAPSFTPPSRPNKAKRTVYTPQGRKDR